MCLHDNLNIIQWEKRRRREGEKRKREREKKKKEGRRKGNEIVMFCTQSLK